jgi:hypothetical protein
MTEEHSNVSLLKRVDLGNIAGAVRSARRAHARPRPLLTGQDVMTPGIAGALAGGMLGAAAIDPRVYRKFR